MTRNIKKNRGRPSKWTDNDLKQLAIDTKYKNHGKKLTPSLLERETKVGRNTWSRRMSNFIDELNNPVLTSVSAIDSNDAILPSVELIFKKYGNNKTTLKNELLELEILLYDFYKELKKIKLKEEKFDKASNEIETLKQEVKKQKERAMHYEQLYNSIVVSSVYPHLQDVKESQTYKHNIKHKLIDMKKHENNSVNLEDLSRHFPDFSGKGIKEKEAIETKKQENMEKLFDKFDI